MRTRIFSAREKVEKGSRLKKVKEGSRFSVDKKVRSHLAANLLVLPGLGTISAGRRIGWVQAAIAATGMGLSLFWFQSFLVQWLQTLEFPFDGGPMFKYGLIGVGLFFIAWTWALCSSLALRRTKNG